MKQTTKARNERQARIEIEHNKVRNIVEANYCPFCGSKVRANSALTGWYQCEQFGAEGFRKDSTRPACSWQGFTE